MGQLYNMLYPNKPSLTTEYEAIDYARFIPVVTTLYREFFNKSQTTINAPGTLIYIFVGHWTQIGQCVADIIKLIAALNLPFYAAIVPLADLLYYIDSEYKTLYKTKLHAPIDKYKCNIYQKLFVNYKKITKEDLDNLKEEFKVFKTLTKIIKKEICTKCEIRKLTPVEVSHVKIFKPKEIEKETLEALAYYNKKYPEVYTFANEVLSFINKEILEYLLKNIKK